MSQARRRRRSGPPAPQPPSAPPPAPAGSSALLGPWTARLAPLAVGLVAAVLLFWGLGERYLWQDEAATAVLGTRILDFGRPLAYDGKNFISTDLSIGEVGAAIDQRTGDPRTAVDYYIRRGDFKADTAWKYHPWGQYVAAASSFALLGRSTWAARLPFALAGLATVLLLYRLVRASTDSRLMAAAAAVLLTFNASWVLHDRQCRYYALSSLFMVLTLLSYTRWLRRGRWGAPAFVASAWCWFQVDYGTVWPALGVLFADAAIVHRRELLRPLALGGALAAALAPFVYYYEMWRRPLLQEGTWGHRFAGTLFDLNEFVVPVLVVLAAAALLVWRRRELPSVERHTIGIACGILGALVLWVPSAAPAAFLRYVIVAAPLGAMLAAWLLVRGLGPRAPQLAWVGVAVLVATPWPSLLLRPLLPAPSWHAASSLVRNELAVAAAEIFGHKQDPNRAVVEWLRRNAAPTDEILVNYEDVPLMFYLPNPIRGGIAAFRVEDDAKTRPRFAVMRRSVRFVHWPVFVREMRRYEWTREPVDAPDVRFGNNPDPSQREDPAAAPRLYVGRRRE